MVVLLPLRRGPSRPPVPLGRSRRRVLDSRAAAFQENFPGGPRSLLPGRPGRHPAPAGGRRAAAGMPRMPEAMLLGPESWFVPGMGCFAAAHACYIA